MKKLKFNNEYTLNVLEKYNEYSNIKDFNLDNSTPDGYYYYQDNDVFDRYSIDDNNNIYVEVLFTIGNSEKVNVEYCILRDEVGIVFKLEDLIKKTRELVLEDCEEGDIDASAMRDLLVNNLI